MATELTAISEEQLAAVTGGIGVCQTLKAGVIAGGILLGLGGADHCAIGATSGSGPGQSISIGVRR